MTNYREKRRLTFDALRSLCIKENWCTLMTNEQYIDMLHRTGNKSNITTNYLESLAREIMSNSELAEGETITTVMFKLCRECYTIFTESF